MVGLVCIAFSHFVLFVSVDAVHGDFVVDVLVEVAYPDVLEVDVVKEDGVGKVAAGAIRMVEEVSTARRVYALTNGPVIGKDFETGSVVDDDSKIVWRATFARVSI